jgi:GntR family transcriptional regulator, rspAB operon transcriptional repressor
VYLGLGTNGSKTNKTGCVNCQYGRSFGRIENSSRKDPSEFSTADTHFSLRQRPMAEFLKQTYSDQVCEYVKEAILNGELSPGDMVNEVVLAKKLSISRAPVREAMQILSRQGLIVIKPQKGKYVTALTADEIKDSYFTGGVLEAAAVADAYDRYQKVDFERMDAILQKMKQVASSGSAIEQMADLDNEFHRILFSRIKNKLLIELCIRSCQGISKFLLFKHWIKLFSAKEIYERHQKIRDALCEGDTQKMEACIRKHYIDAGELMARFGYDVYDSREDLSVRLKPQRN